ncbi:hypothetical protein LIER_21311 [Lithospermum erythrorhizon]|uniref:Uncharacterized protein n=1 Tax=Lithospermum erythrorhizon TaxID=34254 RepID=A0AAV3QPW0_LITER
MKDLRVLKYFLGVEVSRNQEGIFLSQRKYALDIISKAVLLGEKPVAFPMEENQRLANSTSAILHAASVTIGSLVCCAACSKVSEGKSGQGILVTVSRSSAKAEYRSMTVVTCEIKWLKGLLACFGVDHAESMELFCDNQSTLHLAHNPLFHERTKHIEIDCHFLHDAVLEGITRMTHVSTTNQLVDIFTKALGRHQFEFLLCKLGILNIHAPT